MAVLRRFVSKVEELFDDVQLSSSGYRFFVVLAYASFVFLVCTGGLSKEPQKVFPVILWGSAVFIAVYAGVSFYIMYRSSNEFSRKLRALYESELLSRLADLSNPSLHRVVEKLVRDVEKVTVLTNALKKTENNKVKHALTEELTVAEQEFRESVMNLRNLVRERIGTEVEDEVIMYVMKYVNMKASERTEAEGIITKAKTLNDLRSIERRLREEVLKEIKKLEEEMNSLSN